MRSENRILFFLARLLFAPSGSRDLTFACRYLKRVVSVLKRKKILSILFIFEAKGCLRMIKVYAKVVLLIDKSYRNDVNMPSKGGHYPYNFTIDFFFQLFPLQH